MGRTNQEEDLGYVYISERSNEGYENFDTYETYNENGIFFVTYEQVLQSFDVQNRNRRYYDGKNVWECLQTERIQSQLKHNGLFMELDHPMQYYKNQPLTPERMQSIDYDRRCCVIKNPRMEGNLLKATISTTPGAKGPDLAKDIVGIGYRPMASLRAIAMLTNRNGKPYAICRKVITWDTVSFASHMEADMASAAKAVVKKVKAVTESAVDNIKEVASDIVIPLAEILKNVGNKDVNTQLVMESFGLEEKDMIGFDDSHKHVILKDDTNKLYVNLDPKTVKDVNDYFGSF